MNLRNELGDVVARAWQASKDAQSRVSHAMPSHVTDAMDCVMPVLFFGDLDKYEDSTPRVLTVGLNPSHKEFPKCAAFQRFPLAEPGSCEKDQERYLDALSAYFRTHPYEKWFENYEPLLDEMGASYCECQTSRVLHTDICSPVATDPTWSKLSSPDQKVLLDDGARLWNDLLRVLKPNIVILSFAKEHLRRVEFTQQEDWECLHAVECKDSKDPRKEHCMVCGRWDEIGGESALFVFCPPAGRPSESAPKRSANWA